MKGVIVVDPKKCVACKSCELACAIEHSKSKELRNAIAESPLPLQRVKVEGIGELAIPLQCRHCEDAPCVKICPTKATVKSGQEEPVLIKKELCIGCKMCMVVCPFGVISLDRGGKAVVKCDLCIERLKDGKMPACVSVCPTKALQFKDLKKVTKKKRKDYLVKIANEKD